MKEKWEAVFEWILVMGVVSGVAMLLWAVLS